eukprot:jgi/Tetstr1/437851/TSEL_026491.t1
MLIHDNTYLTNQFGMPLGLFSAPDRNGHTVSLAQALTLREGTVDYEWQYSTLLRVTGICPGVIFIDADPGATAAAELVFRHAFIQWCIWHIYKNLHKNLAARLGQCNKQFSRDFAIAQAQISKGTFKALYQSLLQCYPECASYLNKELTHNAKYWANYYCRVFTAGCRSTQRGEAQNFLLKRHLRKNSPLHKLLREVLLKEQWEEARTAHADARTSMNPQLAANFARTVIPAVYDKLRSNLTNYGLNEAVKQVQASAIYDVALCSMEQDRPCVPSGHTIELEGDADLADLPRFSSITEALAGLHLTSTASAAHALYIIFTNSVRSGVPCRHFWAVFINSGRGAFHLGMIHDLWFRQAQPMREEITLFIPVGGEGRTCIFQHCRPMLGLVANAGEDEVDIGALHLQLGDHNHVRDRIGKMAVYGELLGAAKRAIQAVVDGALPHDDLLHYLQRVATDGCLPTTEGANYLPASLGQTGRH